MGVQVCVLPCARVFSGVFRGVFCRVFAVCVGVCSHRNTRDEHPAGGLNHAECREIGNLVREGREASC